jgi:hypothetical protein
VSRRIMPNFALICLIWSLLAYLMHLYHGDWFWAAGSFLICALNCSSLWMIEERCQLQRALDELARVRRECLEFLLKLPGQIFVTIDLAEDAPMDIANRKTIRFRTVLRGQEVDVEMGIRSLSPVTFSVHFHGPVPPGGPLTRKELVALAREAARVSAAQFTAH